MTGQGGMKALFPAVATQQVVPNTGTPTAATPTATSMASTFRPVTNNISLSVQPTVAVGRGTSVHLVAVHEDGLEIHEIIDADVNVKHKGGDLEEPV